MPYIVKRPAAFANDMKPPLVVNGETIEYEFDTPIELPDAAVDALLLVPEFTVYPVDGNPEMESESEIFPPKLPEGGTVEPIEPEPDLPVETTEPQSPVVTDGGDGAASPDGGAADGGADTTTTEPHPLDHDGDGKKGGSLPKARRKKPAAE